MAKGGFSHAAMRETQHTMKKPYAEVREEMQWAVESPAKQKVKAAMKRSPAIVRENQTDGCLPFRNSAAKNLQTCCRRKETAAPPPELALPPPGTPPVAAAKNERAQSYEIEGVPPGYVYIRTPLPNAQFFNLDAYSKNRKRDKDSIPDLLTDERTSTV